MGRARGRERGSRNESESGPADIRAPGDTTHIFVAHRARIYQRSCQICHGSDGRGGPTGSRLTGVPDFTNQSWQASRSPAQLETSILEGKGQRMPGFRDKLGTGQAAALVSFVRSFASIPAQPLAAPSSDFDRRLSRLQREFEEASPGLPGSLASPPAPRP